MINALTMKKVILSLIFACIGIINVCAATSPKYYFPKVAHGLELTHNVLLLEKITSGTDINVETGKECGYTLYWCVDDVDETALEMYIDAHITATCRVNKYKLYILSGWMLCDGVLSNIYQINRNQIVVLIDMCNGRTRVSAIETYNEY